MATFPNIKIALCHTNYRLSWHVVRVLTMASIPSLHCVLAGDFESLGFSHAYHATYWFDCQCVLFVCLSLVNVFSMFTVSTTVRIAYYLLTFCWKQWQTEFIFLFKQILNNCLKTYQIVDSVNGAGRFVNGEECCSLCSSSYFMLVHCRVNAVSNGQVRGDGYNEGCLGTLGMACRHVSFINCDSNNCEHLRLLVTLYAYNWITFFYYELVFLFICCLYVYSFLIF